MSILSWFKQVSSSVTSAGLIDTESMTFSKGEEQFHGLDMKGALDAHIAWTRRLEGKISGENREQLDVATVASDCECKLGKWIHGTAKQQFGGSADYNELRRVHADFHLKAGEILNNVINGDQAKALGNLKEIRYQSGNVQLSLVRLYSHAQH
jgi:hypothetical protein